MSSQNWTLSQRIPLSWATESRKRPHLSYSVQKNVLPELDIVPEDSLILSYRVQKTSSPELQRPEKCPPRTGHCPRGCPYPEEGSVVPTFVVKLWRHDKNHLSSRKKKKKVNRQKVKFNFVFYVIIIISLSSTTDEHKVFDLTGLLPWWGCPRRGRHDQPQERASSLWSPRRHHDTCSRRLI